MEIGLRTRIRILVTALPLGHLLSAPSGVSKGLVATSKPWVTPRPVPSEPDQQSSNRCDVGVARSRCVRSGAGGYDAVADVSTMMMPSVNVLSKLWAGSVIKMCRCPFKVLTMAKVFARRAVAEYN
jgi:hypothetical protein